MNTFRIKIGSLLCGLFLLSISFVHAAEKDWLTSIEEGVKQAKKEHKHVLVEFTGSDWCPPCIMMHKKVFSKNSFVKGAQKNFVLVVLDIPNKDKALRKKNDAVMKKYKVRGVPTVILMDADGKEFSRFPAARYPSVQKFLHHLKQELRREKML